MNDDTSRKQLSNESNALPSRRRYERPVLTVYGLVRELTNGPTTASTVDGQSSMRP